MKHKPRRKKQLRAKEYEEEMRFEKATLEQKLKFEKRTGQKKEQDINAKMPKLVITKFKGTPADWLRFLVQFAAEVNATNFSQVTTFSYLKELLEPQVRSSTDDLPLTTVGYERAKNILKTKSGKESEIVNACLCKQHNVTSRDSRSKQYQSIVVL